MPPSGPARGWRSEASTRELLPSQRFFNFGRWLKRLLQLLLFAGWLALTIACYFGYKIGREFEARAASYDLSQLEHLNVTTSVVDRNGKELARFFVEDRIWVPGEQIPAQMRRAVISAEDRRFYEHRGVDYKAIGRAVVRNLRAGTSVEGGSTITQQLAKHLLADFSRRFERKLLEAFLARRLERQYSKDEILTYYLNRIYFGRGHYGVGAAARGYFGKKIGELTLAESALLAGIIRAPTTYSLNQNLPGAIRRRNQVLDAMQAIGYAAPGDVLRAKAQEVHLVPPRPAGARDYVTAQVLKELDRVLELQGGEEPPQGLRVVTTLDNEWQKKAEPALRQELAKLAKKAALSDEKKDSEGPLQASFLAADAATGAIRVWIGGRKFEESQFDRVVMALRENGGLLEPPVYALAFEQLGLHPASRMNAAALDFSQPLAGQDLQVGVAASTDRRTLILQEALRTQNPNVAMRVTTRLGADKLTSWLGRGGLSRRKPIAATGNLDGEVVSLYEAVGLYQALANQGLRKSLYLIESVVSRDGRILYQETQSTSRRPTTAGGQLISAQTAQQMRQTLLTVGGTITAPTREKLASFATASSNGRDGWWIGSAPDLVVGTWVGFDDARPIGIAQPGEAIARTIGTACLLAAKENDSQKEARTALTEPVTTEGLIKVEVDPRTGELSGLGWMTPGQGHVFAWLTQEQINQAQRTFPQKAIAVDSTDAPLTAAQVQAPSSGLSWLTTLLPTTRTTAESAPAARFERPKEIPAALTLAIPGLRGEIRTQDNVALASLAQTYQLVLAWPSAQEAATEADAIDWMRDRLGHAREVLALPGELTSEQLTTLFRLRRFQPVLVATDLSEPTLMRWRQSDLHRIGFSLEGYPKRVYPKGTAAAHALGYLGRAQRHGAGAYQAGEVICDRFGGVAGLEQAFEKMLAGRDGEFVIRTTTEGFARQAQVQKAAERGLNLRTTLVWPLQQAAEAALAERKTAALVALDVTNGGVLAMASTPAFNPNAFAQGVEAAHWEGLCKDPAAPLLNRTFQAQYPPGSVFKIVTTLAAMDAAEFDPSYEVTGTGRYTIGDVVYQLPKEVGTFNFNDAFVRSINTYFFNLALKIGRAPLVTVAKRVGIGQRTGLGLPGELAGRMPDPTFIQQAHGRVMSGGDLANIAIGQGDVLTTPLQAAQLAALIAHDGKLYQPRLAAALEDASGRAVKTFDPQLGVQIQLPANIDYLKEAMVQVVEQGTGAPAKIKGWPIAAKTGTAQIGSKDKPRQIAWLVGYCPSNAPRVAFAVMIEGGEGEDLHGGADAGSAARPFLQATRDWLEGRSDRTPEKSETAESTPPAAPETSTEEKLVPSSIPMPLR